MVEPERIHEGVEIVDEVGGRPAVAGQVPARAAMPAGVGHVAAQPPARIGRSVAKWSRPVPVAPWSMTMRRSGALDLVGGREPVGIDGRHRATMRTGILAPMPSLIVRGLAHRAGRPRRLRRRTCCAARLAGRLAARRGDAGVRRVVARLSHPDPLGDHLRLWSEADGGPPVAWSWHEPPELEIARLDRRPGSRQRGIPHDRRRRPSTRPATAGCRRSPPTTMRARSTSSRRWGSRRRGAGCRSGCAGGATARRRRSSCRTATGSARCRGPTSSGLASTLHRAAFPKSALSVAKYERLHSMPHYRLEDDLVVEAPDGELAAFVLAWWDPDGRVAEFEPVGTHPDHQRRGLSRALLTAGLRPILRAPGRPPSRSTPTRPTSRPRRSTRRPASGGAPSTSATVGHPTTAPDATIDA